MLAFGGELLQEVAANRVQRPAGIMAVQEIGGGVEFLLCERARGAKNLVARVAAGRNQHDDDTAIGKQPHPGVFENGPAQRRRNNDAESVRDFRENVAGAFSDFRGGGARWPFRAGSSRGPRRSSVACEAISCAKKR